MPRFPKFWIFHGVGKRTRNVLAMRWVLLALLGSTLLSACTQLAPAARLQIQQGDRQREWGLVYYQSWQKEKNREYLLLARQRTQEAIALYLDVQRRMGYAYPDFYVVDSRRMASCHFLRQLQSEAAGYDLNVGDAARVGCFD